MGIENGAEKQQEHDAEDDKGEHIIIAVVKQQKYESQDNRGAYPDNLHT